MTEPDSKDPNKNDAATPSRPVERRLPNSDRLNLLKMELLAALARKSDTATESAGAADTTMPTAGEYSAAGQPAAPSAGPDVVELLRTLAERETESPEQDASTDSLNAAEHSSDQVTSIVPPADSDALAPSEARSSRRLGGRPAASIVAIVILLAAVIGSAGVLWKWSGAGSSLQPRQAKPETTIAVQKKGEAKPAATSTAPASTPAPREAPDFLAAQKAMKDCDDAAANNLDSIFFVVIPIKPARGTVDELAKQGDRFDKFALLPSQAAMAGLQDRSIALDPKRYTFTAIDTGSEKLQKFDAANGLSRFAWHDDSTVLKFKIGFETAGLGAGPRWSGETERVRGICYWINVLLHD